MYPNPSWSRPIALVADTTTIGADVALVWEGAESSSQIRIASSVMAINGGSTARAITLPTAADVKAKGAHLTFVNVGSALQTYKLSTGTTLVAVPAGGTVTLCCKGTSATDWIIVGSGQASQTGLLFRQSVTLVAVTDFNAAATTQSVNVGAALPTGAEIVFAGFNLNTEFSGGAVSAATLSIGVSGTLAAFTQATSVFTGAGTGRKRNDVATNVTTGSGKQVLATLVTTTANLSALTAGSATIDLLYTVL